MSMATAVDFGSIAVTTIGSGASRGCGSQRDRGAVHPLFMMPYEGYVAVAEQLNRLTGRPRRSALFSSGAEAVETR